MSKPQESIICEQCGNVKSIFIDVPGTTHELATIPPIKFCKGHPEKHDGTIDERYDMHVRMLGKTSIICIHAGVNDVFFYPKQALSLLDWLTQEQSTLEQLAKE